MEFGILGPLRASHDGRVLDLGRPKQHALLAVLLLHANETVAVDRLADDLWEQRPPKDLTAALQAHVSRLRSALAAGGGGGPSLVVTRAPGYRIDLPDDGLDALRFRAMARGGRAALAAGRPEDALGSLETALSLWRGPPLAELSLGPLAQGDVRRLDEQRLTTQEDLLDALLALGRHREALEQLDDLVGEHPLRERLWALRITALYRSGRQAEALRAYGEVRRILAEELGLSPGPELQALEAAVLAQRPDLGAPAPAPPPPPPPPHRPPLRAGNLPLPLTTFVGRSDERAEVARLLAERRLVTLVGFGGAGKTRLALEVATDLQPDHADGAWFVDLSSATDGTAVARAVAALVEVREDPSRPMTATLVEALRDRDLLVVLDNCEHLVRASADLAGTLLRSCPGLRVLATSREPLGVPGEALFAVPPLALPDPSAARDAVARAESVQLFADRATLVRRDFAVTDDNVGAVTSICRRLDGIPLAIELAAARVAVLSPQQIDQRLADRFRLLADEAPGRPDRHRTLAATMEWSDALLGATERILLWRLSVFAGGFGLDAAEAVCPGGVVERDSVLDHLARLVAKSLVVADTAAAEARYRLLEAIRQHGADRLSTSGEAPGLLLRHARWCLELAERAEPELGGPRQDVWLDRLTLEHDNLRAALGWSVAQGNGELALRLAGALVLFWRVRGHVTEAREWLAAALAVPCDALPAVRAKALWGAGFMATMAGDHGAAVPALEQSIVLWQEAGDEGGMARVLLLLGNSRRFTDGSLVALLLLDESVAHARSAGDAWCLAHALSLAGSAHLEEGHLAEAEAMLGEALAMAAGAGDLQGARVALWGLGELRVAQGRLADAEAALAEGLAVARRLREPHAECSFASSLADVARVRGDHGRARRLLDDALVTAHDAGPGTEVEVRCAEGALVLAQGDAAGAHAAYAGALVAANRARAISIRALLGLAHAARSRGDAAGARRFAEEALAASEAAGNRRGRAAALDVAARLAADAGRDAEAWRLHRESLVSHREAGEVLGTVRAVAALGALAARSTAPGVGARLLAAASTVRAAFGAVATPAEQAEQATGMAAAGQALPADLLAAAVAAGRATNLDEAAKLALGLAPPDARP